MTQRQEVPGHAIVTQDPSGDPWVVTYAETSTLPQRAAEPSARPLAPELGKVEVGPPPFNKHTPMEKRILAALWEGEKKHPHQPGKRFGLKIPMGMPQHEGFVTARRTLRLEGLLAISAVRGHSFLTDEGLLYCAMYQQEIEDWGKGRR